MKLVKESLDIFKVPRYLIHATSSKNRESIYRKGLIPKNPKKNFYYSKEQAEYIDYEKPAIFATTLKDELDIYDFFEIKNQVLLVPNVLLDNEEEYNEYISRAQDKTDFFKCYKSAKHSWQKDICVEEVEKELDKLIRKESKFDVWLINNDIAQVNWYKDNLGYGGNWLDGLEFIGSVLTYEPISPKALKLIIASGKQIIVRRR
jgi:hypothetical protein